MKKKSFVILCMVFALLLGGCSGTEEAKVEMKNPILSEFVQNKEDYGITDVLSDDPARKVTRYYRSISGIEVINDYFDVSTAENGTVLEIKKTVEKANPLDDAEKLVDSFSHYQDKITESVYSSENSEYISEVRQNKAFFIIDGEVTPILLVDVVYQFEYYSDMKILCFNMLDGAQIDYEEMNNIQYLPSEYPST